VSRKALAAGECVTKTGKTPAASALRLMILELNNKGISINAASGNEESVGPLDVLAEEGLQGRW